MSAQRFTLRTFAPSLCSLALLLSTVGCDSQTAEQAAPAPIKVHNIRMLYPPETRGVIMGAIERFNAKNIALSNGSVARLTGASFDDYAATGKIGTPSLETSLWIPPFSPLSAEALPQTDREISGCVPLMSTRLGVTVRPIDTFVLPSDKEKLSITSLLTPQEGSNRPQPAIIVGAPRFASSGLLAALLTTAEASKTPLEQLSPQAISSNAPTLAKVQERVRNYFVNDDNALEWLANRQGGEPLEVITTEQAVRSFKGYHPSAALEWFPFTSPGASLDYPLCDVTSKNDSPDDLEAAKLARTFFSSDEFKSLIAPVGFSAPLPASSTPQENLAAAIRQLLSTWAQIRRPSSTVFVVDTSIKTDLTNMETIRRELSLFVDRRPSKDDTVALVSASSDPDVLREPETDPELLKLSISRLTTAGGNAIRDGIRTAFNIFEDTSSTNYRRSVVVFTSAKDTSSQTTIDQLTNRASQLVGRKNVDLFVIAIGGSEQDFGELPAVTRKVGGTFVLTDIPSLPGKFYAIGRRVQ